MLFKILIFQDLTPFSTIFYYDLSGFIFSIEGTLPLGNKIDAGMGRRSTILQKAALPFLQESSLFK